MQEMYGDGYDNDDDEWDNNDDDDGNDVQFVISCELLERKRQWVGHYKSAKCQQTCHAYLLFMMMMVVMVMVMVKR